MLQFNIRTCFQTYQTFTKILTNHSQIEDLYNKPNEMFDKLEKLDNYIQWDLIFNKRCLVTT